MKSPELARTFFVIFHPNSLTSCRRLRKNFHSIVSQVFAALVFSSLLSCGDEQQPEITPNPSSPSGKSLSVIKENPKEETFKSLFEEKLKAAYERYPQEVYSHSNSARADFLEGKLEASNNSATVKQLLIYGDELLSAGRTKEAIQILEQTGRALRERGIGVGRDTKRFFDSLAMAYLRLGEDENCCAHFNEESCLFPIKGKAVHTNRRGSESAIAILKEILDSFPQDYQSRYLLNLAYMTLGDYPDKVPVKLLIPKMGEPSGFDFPKFPNIATSVGADTSGMSGGLCLEDFNNDGLLDVFSSSWGLKDNVTLLTNTGKTFKDETKLAGLDGVVSGLNMIHADYDNDGDNDVFLLRGAWFEEQGRHPNSLLRNCGDGSFEDVTIQAGVYSEYPTQTACWADFNNDGYLDLFIGNENKRDSKYEYPCELYLNQKDGTFKNIAKIAGVSVEVFAKGCAAADFNNDGWQDLYVSCLGEVNLLFENQGVTNEGIPRFRNVAQSAGVEEPLSSFPCWFFDYNNDGHQDIFVADFDSLGFSNMGGLVALEMMGKETEAEKPRLYRNRGNGTFEDVTREKGLWRSMFAMGVNFGDLNNDGYLDFYIGTGAPDLRMIVPNLMFLNDKGEKFLDITVEGRFGSIQKGHAIGFGDIDNDGDQDVYAVMGGAIEGDAFHNLLFKNPGWENHWVTLELEGKVSNRSAVGAIVRVGVIDNAGNKRYFHRRVGTGGSFGSSSLRQEIGLGACRNITGVEINWPNGTDIWERIRGVKLDSAYRILEGEGAAKEWALAKSSF